MGTMNNKSEVLDDGQIGRAISARIRDTARMIKNVFHLRYIEDSTELELLSDEGKENEIAYREDELFYLLDALIADVLDIRTHVRSPVLELLKSGI
jgi:hypothetical protein